MTKDDIITGEDLDNSDNYTLYTSEGVEGAKLAFISPIPKCIKREVAEKWFRSNLGYLVWHDGANITTQSTVLSWGGFTIIECLRYVEEFKRSDLKEDFELKYKCFMTLNTYTNADVMKTK